MGATSSILKTAINALKDELRKTGKQINADEIEEIVMLHAGIGAAAGVGGMLPGAGPVLATGANVVSVVTMYVRLSKAIGITLEEGVLKAIASAVVADISSAIVGSLALSTVLSFIPGIGSVPSAIIIGAANFGVVYLAAMIFLKLITVLIKSRKDVSSMTAEELAERAKKISEDMDKSSAIKEAKKIYEDSQKDKK